MITIILIFLNVAIFLLKPDVLKYGQIKGNKEYYRLFTSLFIHGSIFHLLSNMYALLTNGIFLEKHYSSIKMAFVYILTGIVGNVISELLGNYKISFGASGAIFGLIGLKMVYLYTIGKISSDKLKNDILYIVSQHLTNKNNGIDIWSHIGGLLSGSLFGFIL